MSLFHKETPPEHILRFQVGDICCALEVSDTEVYQWLDSVYHEYETEQSPDITIKLEVTDHLSLEKLEKSVFKSKFIQWAGRNFMTTHRIMSGNFNQADHVIRLKAERPLYNPGLKINHLNRLTSLAYYTACKLKYAFNPPAMFVHTCCILRNGQALLFTGPSEIGKTTIARLCGEQDGEVVNDEMVLVYRPGRNGKGVSMQSTPALGTFPTGRKLSAPVRCLFVLRQGNTTQARPLEKTDVYTKLLRQIISPACVGQKDKKSIYSMMADFSAEVVQAVPAFELEFQVDGDSLWRTIGEIEKTLNQKEGQ